MANIDDLRIEGALPRPRRKRRNPVGAVVWLLLLLGGAWYFLHDRAPGVLAKLALPRSTAMVEVFTVPDTAAGAAGAISAGAYLEVIPPGPALVSTLIAGKLLSVDVVEGERVKRGQVIARIDAGLYEQQALVLASRVELAKAELKRQQAGFRSEEIDAATAGVNEAQARLTRAQADHDRSQQLYAAGVVARSSLDQTQSELDQARSAVQARQAQLDLLQAGTRREDVEIFKAALGAAQAELRQVQFNVAQCSIRAQSEGVIYQQLARPGDWLSPGTGELAAGGVVSTFDPSQIQAWCDVNQRDSERISIGQRVTLSTDAQPQRQIPGVVKAIMPRANMQKNTLQVKIRILDPPEDLRPELAVKVTFTPQESQLEKRPAGIAIPSTALTERQGQPGVLIFAAGTAQWRNVEREVQADGQVLVTSGLSPGEQLILNPAKLTDGQSVKLKSEAKP